MNTLYFKYAVEVERTGSITQAADNLYMGQPNLSKAIKELEDTLGITIFKRTSKGVIATQKGEEFLKHAKKILAQISEMEEICRDDSHDKQTFNISIPRGSYIAKAVTNFISTLDEEKEIEVNVKETNSMEAIHNIIEGQFNLGIIRYETMYESYFLDFLNNKDIMHDIIWEFEYLTVMSKDHPLADCENLKDECLVEYIEIKHGDTSVPYINTENAKNSKNVSRASKNRKVIYVYERCSQFDMLSNIPVTFMWVSPIPEEFLKRYNLVQRKCKTKNHKKYKDVLIYPKGYLFNSLDKKFMDKLYESKNAVALKQYS